MNKLIYEPTDTREIKILSQDRSYLATSETFCNTKLHHGLFVTRIPERNYVFHILLSSLDETIFVNNCDYQLAHHHFQGSHFPNGNIYISHHETEPTFTTFYSMGPLMLKKEIVLSVYQPAIYIRYSLLESLIPTKIRFSPFLAFRNIYGISSQNNAADLSISRFQNGISSKLYENFPTLFMQISNNHSFVNEPSWYKNFEYDGNLHEDLFTPGYFELPLKQGESCIFAASLDKISDFDAIKNLFGDQQPRKISCAKKNISKKRSFQLTN